MNRAAMTAKRKEPGRTAKTVVVILGSSGNLSTHQLLPSLRSLKSGALRILGVDWHEPETLPREIDRFIKGDLLARETYEDLTHELDDLGGANHLFHLATNPQLFRDIVERLKASGLNGGASGWCRIMVEKPFGVDLASSRKLEQTLGRAFTEERTFRIDHFIAKPVVEEMTRFRLTESTFEPIWDSRHVDNIQIWADEKDGVEDRFRFYDDVGVLRDMVQSHLLQLLSLVAMERPKTHDYDGISDAKARVLSSICVPEPTQVVWGQYEGYGAGGAVNKSTTPTFVALRLSIDNERWQKVPFYIRTGKMLDRKETRIVISFKKGLRFDSLVFKVDPPKGIFHRSSDRPRETKVAAEGMPWNGRSTEYERLYSEAIRADHTHFVRPDFTDLAWKLCDPLQRRRDEDGDRNLHHYARTSRGPREADELLAGDGRSWSPDHPRRRRNEPL